MLARHSLSRLAIPFLAAAFALASLLPAAIRAEDEEGFLPLFDGKSLDAFEQHGGKAEYRLEDGVVVGKSVPSTPNSFLCTRKEYGDFILEFEFLVDPALNSGVQIRSHVYDKPMEYETTNDKGETKTIKVSAGRVHGYQVEIDPSARAWSTGIYDEGRRGWLNSLADNEPARKAFKQNEWNKVRVECRGESIRTWLNGVPAADLKDGMTPRGFIALQVHGVGGDEKKVGKEVRWRNLRIKEL